ncbi:hypothetical protein BOW35_09750 [Solemya velum gill symbiont]|uniref:HvfC family RiPP maturation protein n=1 Tax=Solemya velum gill symbiont TaxID=2340 RepID=UPI0009CE6428|nr:putative DNA-binding domain-containing protein [Solemya velum gill symbiont]OOZ13923.1 hypothetical protein BOW27_08635 [Solemya velum gill symbiont]OOZ16791.1 hypothetical protein BOW28_08825 [Solemya velum gill symbiont]OOZ19107.1 hypothetical protein BOW29_08545 [Solemya velum gill symbiont]OOZ21522.1 hypothetical protein BOW30_09145 [Solemya velum gill symbiont]OOZ23582.1 hypothetical protein BOW31_09190 [Solemya velum gill symbiont]
MTQHKSRLAQQQFEFTSALRDPDCTTIPAGVPHERLEAYRELFFNNVRGILESAFPVIHEILPTELSETLARRFFREHSSHTPEFPRFPREFLLWLEQREMAEEGEPPFLYQLALWEWTELDVLLDPAAEPQPAGAMDDVLAQVPLLAPTLQLHAFDYPVHRISADFIPEEPLETQVYLVAFRTPDEGIEFIELNQASAALVQVMLESPGKTGEEYLRALAELMGYADAEQLLGFGREFFNDLYQQGVLVGTLEHNKSE